jgi:SAM-dependent methyltransferase
MSESLSPFRKWRHRIWGFNIFNRREWLAQRAARLPRGSRVLDVGAGIGQYRPLFAHCRYETQDFGQEPATIGTYTPLDYQSDITAIPVADGSFDAVVCTEVLEHVPHPVEALKEMARILRPGGHLFLTAPLGSNLHQEPYHFYGGYTPHWYRRFLPENGFEIESMEANEGFFSFFGQEAQRFVLILRGPEVKRVPLPARVMARLIAFLMVPFAYALPLVGAWLDSLHLESITTIGYHVVARRRV